MGFDVGMAFEMSTGMRHLHAIELKGEESHTMVASLCRPGRG
jgi:hypothetical protein